MNNIMEVYGDGATIRREDKPRSKCRKWTLRVQTDHGPKEKRFNGTFSEAKKALEEFKAKLVLNISDIKFKEYVETWYKRRERSGDFAPSTLEKDRNTIRVLCKVFGDMKLSSITRANAVDGLLELKEENDYSSWYHNGLFVRLKSILTSAVRDGMLGKNVLDGEKAPKIGKTTRQALSMGEASDFMLRLSIEPLKPHVIAVYIALLTGARRGEICGFTWADVDARNKAMGVRRSIMDNGKSKTPKTTAGFRIFPIVSQLQDILDRWQRIQEKELKAIGVKQTLETPIVNNDMGDVMNPQNLDRWWRQNRDSYGLPGVVLHELRHTYLTLLANSGAPSKVVQGIAGWSNLAMADIYVHDDLSAQRKAVDNLEGFLARQGVTSSDTSNDTSEPSESVL